MNGIDNKPSFSWFDFMIYIAGKPMFSCVQNFAVADVYDSDITLSCDVTARPLPSEMFVYWYGANKYKMQIHVGEEDGVYQLTKEKRVNIYWKY